MPATPVSHHTSLPGRPGGIPRSQQTTAPPPPPPLSLAAAICKQHPSSHPHSLQQHQQQQRPRGAWRNEQRKVRQKRTRASMRGCICSRCAVFVRGAPAKTGPATAVAAPNALVTSLSAAKPVSIVARLAASAALLLPLSTVTARGAPVPMAMLVHTMSLPTALHHPHPPGRPLLDPPCLLLASAVPPSPRSQLHPLCLGWASDPLLLLL